MNINFHNTQPIAFSKLFYTVFFSNKCYQLSICLISLLFLILYCFSFSQKTINSDVFNLSILESEDTCYWIIIWLIICIVLILLWNVYLFLFTSIFKYEYCTENNTVLSSDAEDAYKNPISYLFILYHFNNKYVTNAIDNSIWFFISCHYFFISFYLTQCYINIDKEIALITNFSSKTSKKLLVSIKNKSLFFLLINFIFSLFIYLITIEIDLVFQCIILGKGVYIMIKTIELWVTRKNEIQFLQLEMNVKEKYLISNLKAKTFLGLIKMACIFYLLVAIYIYSDSQPFYFTIPSFGIILMQGYQGLLFYKKYENLKEYYRELDSSLTQKNAIDEECVICTEKLKNARILNCNHLFHLICLSKWFEKGHKTCPICRNEISIQESPCLVYSHQNQRNEITIGLTINFVNSSWLPNISMRIIQTRNQSVSTRFNNYLNL